MGNNLMRTAKYASSEDSANRAFADAALRRVVGASVTLSPLLDRRAAYPGRCLAFSPFITRRGRSALVSDQPTATLFPPHGRSAINASSTTLTEIS
jgi:hypothetical protein